MNPMPARADRTFWRAFATPFGELVIVWSEERLHEGHQRAIVRRLYVPRDGVSQRALALQEYAGLREGEHPVIESLAATLGRYLRGEAVEPPLSFAALSDCPAFQQAVLRAEHAVPRGWVTTYGRLAAHLGSPRAARAVGSALAHNPFPLLIPCHRALRADLSLGGYQGGLAMKRALLELEGQVIAQGRVSGDAPLWYA
jgi:methylated-DNA-[protein]-cysteine S-methyltransferase